MDTTQSDRFDFEYWQRLAAEDPTGFETARKLAVTAMIESAPEPQKRRMQGLQWRIDKIRERAPNPMAACLRLSAMMWNSMLGDGGLLEALRDLERIDPAKVSSRRTAKVIPLGRQSSAPGSSDP